MVINFVCLCTKSLDSPPGLLVADIQLSSLIASASVTAITVSEGRSRHACFFFFFSTHRFVFQSVPPIQ